MKFTVFGVARSGTTALAHAINLHPALFCAIEALPPDLPLAGLRFPDAFLNPALVGHRADHIRQQLENRPGTVLGNKFPRYFLHLHRIRQELGSVIHVGIYRENLDFCYSWEQRASGGVQWHAGRTTVAAVLEQLLFLWKLLGDTPCPSVHVFRYDDLFRTDPSTVESIYALLGVDPEACREPFRRQLFNQPKVFSKSRPENAIQCRAREIFGIQVFDEYFGELKGDAIGEVPKTVRDSLERAMDALPRFMNEVAADLTEVERQYLRSQLAVYRTHIPSIAPSIEYALSTQRRCA